ncbi:DNA-methyltransferase [Acidisoma sp. C75]
MLDQTKAAAEWSIGRQRILQTDCLAGLSALAAESVDVCVTSPPYNIGIAYRSYADRLPRAQYLDWMAEVGRAIARVLKPEGSLFLNVGSTGNDPWIASDVADAMTHDLVLQNHIVWVKSLSMGEDTFGHFKPINSDRFLNNNHESIYHFTKSGRVAVDRLAIGVPFKDKSNIARWGHARDRRCAGNVWFLPYQTVKSRAQKFDHPAGFPVELPARCIRLAGREDPLVLDPFLGAGTTLVAAEALGARGIGFEIDGDYAARAAARLAAAVTG